MSQAVADSEQLGQLLDDHAREAVPRSEGIAAIRIAMIMVGMTIALPAFILGSELGAGLGFHRMIIACFCGGAMLAVVAIASAVAGARARVSTYVLIVAAFGRTGGRLANGLIGLSLLGWFGVIMMMFGRSAAQIVGQADVNGAVISWAAGGAILMVASAIIGFRAIDRLSAILTPAKVILLLTAAVTALVRYGAAVLSSPASASPISLSTAITLVVGSLVIGAAVQPDVTRYARSPGGAAAASGIVFGLAFPLVLLLAGIPSIATRQPDLVAVMVALGLGIPAIATVLLAAWTNNTYNLYASSLVLATILVRQPRWRLTVIVGLIGTALGLLGISDQLVPYLVLLSILIPPIAGIYLSNYYGNRNLSLELDDAPSWCWHAALAWVLAAGFGAIEAARHFSIAGLPAVDTLILSAGIYAALSKLGRRWRTSLP